MNIVSDDDNVSDEGYESNDEIGIEITDCNNGASSTHIYSIPYRPTHSNQKRLICFSTINNETCTYGTNCTYAHCIDEQVIDWDKKFIYQIIFDKDLMNFYSLTNPNTDNIFKQLLFMTNLCDKCLINKCTGGYNCRNGVCDTSLKICKNDLLTGECLNKIKNIDINQTILNKLRGDDFNECENYEGCLNGHHLSLRGLLPYYNIY